MNKIQELEAEIARLQAELASVRCRENMPVHIVHGTVCKHEKNGHKWHETSATHNTIHGIYVVTVKWKTEEIDSE